MKPKSFCKHLVITVLLVRYNNNWRVYIWQFGRLCSTCVPELLLVFVSDTLQFIGAHCPSWWVGQNWKVCLLLPLVRYEGHHLLAKHQHMGHFTYADTTEWHMPSTLYLSRNSWHHEVQLPFGLIESKIYTWHPIVFTVYFSVKCRQTSTTSMLITNFHCCLTSSIYMFQLNNPS